MTFYEINKRRKVFNEIMREVQVIKGTSSQVFCFSIEENELFLKEENNNTSSFFNTQSQRSSQF